MSESQLDISDTFLTRRQADVLSFRSQGMTQQEIADEFGSTVANVSAIENAARENVRSAQRTLDLATVLQAVTSFEVKERTDLRSMIDEIYRQGDKAGVKITFTEPELSTHLHSQLLSSLEERKLTTSIRIGITTDGDVIPYPITRSQ